MKPNTHASRLLIIAPIGDPAVWRMARYVIKEKTYSTCCCAIALTLFSTQKYATIDLLLQAMDSLICSQLLGEWSSKNPMEERQHLSETLEKLFTEELIKAAERSSLSAKEENGRVKVGGSEVRVGVALSQSAGQYPVNRANSQLSSVQFNGDPTAVFAKIVNTAGPHRDADVILDLTHGVNYLQTMAVYAIETLKPFRETQVVIHNSSPYPATYTSPQCFTVQQQLRSPLVRIEEAPTLNVFDASGLLEISNLAASLSQFALNQRDVETIQKSVTTLANEYKWPAFIRLARHIILAWHYLASGVPSLGYLHAVNANLETQTTKIEDMICDMEKAEPDSEFNYEGDRGEVIYKNPSDWHSAMPTIIWNMHRTLNQILKPTSRVTTMEHLRETSEMLAQRNPLYSSIAWRLKYEHEKIKRVRKRTRLQEFAVGVNDDLREMFFGTVQKLSSHRDAKERRRHLVSHVGITCEPINHIGFRDRTYLTLELGKLGDDPFDAWKLQ